MERILLVESIWRCSSLYSDRVMYRITTDGGKSELGKAQHSSIVSNVHIFFLNINVEFNLQQ